MNPLAAMIAAEIGQYGPMAVDRYMDLALQHPEYGYYRQAKPIGGAGDFITAPEISQMFGEMIGLWCVAAWRGMGAPTSFTLLELGPGLGTLMCDALRATQHVAGFHNALQIMMLESHAALRRRQIDAVAPFVVTHIDSIDGLPEQPLIFIANEFFDALPIKQYARRDGVWREVKIKRGHGGFIFCDDVCESGLDLAPQLNIYEVSAQAQSILGALSRHAGRYGGAGIIVDYGYETPPDAGTLQAVRAHQKVDFLSDPGQVDLTALVDFSALARTVHAQGAQVTNLCGQGDFLRGMGIVLRAQQLIGNATPEQRRDIESALHRLTDQTEMGTLFRVMTLMS